jgi:hypothetical protein
MYPVVTVGILQTEELNSGVEEIGGGDHRHQKRISNDSAGCCTWVIETMWLLNSQAPRVNHISQVPLLNCNCPISKPHREAYPQ